MKIRDYGGFIKVLDVNESIIRDLPRILKSCYPDITDEAIEKAVAEAKIAAAEAAALEENE